MSLFRIPSVLATALVSAAVACSAYSSNETANTPASTDTTESELKITPSATNTASLDVGDGSTCASFRSLLEGRLEDVKALCKDGEIALPQSVDADGCEAGSAKKITFKCFIANLPPPPPAGACRPLRINDEKGALPPKVSEHGPDFAPAVCPHLGGLHPPPPPPPGAGPVGSGGAGEPPQPPKPPAGAPNDAPLPGQPGAGQGQGAPPAGAPPAGAPPAGAPPAGAPPAGAPPAGAAPSGGPNGGPAGGPPPPPRFECCAPPPPPAHGQPGQGTGQGGAPQAPAVE